MGDDEFAAGGVFFGEGAAADGFEAGAEHDGGDGSAEAGALDGTDGVRGEHEEADEFVLACVAEEGGEELGVELVDDADFPLEVAFE